MVYLFLIAVAFLALLVYVVIVFSESPEIAEARLGALEPLPEHLGQWRRDDDSEAARAALREGLYRETRTLHEDGGVFGGGTLVTQARLRDRRSHDIVRVEAEVRRRRRRVHTGQGG